MISVKDTVGFQVFDCDHAEVTQSGDLILYQEGTVWCGWAAGSWFWFTTLGKPNEEDEGAEGK